MYFQRGCYNPDSIVDHHDHDDKPEDSDIQLEVQVPGPMTKLASHGEKFESAFMRVTVQLELENTYLITYYYICNYYILFCIL